MSRVVDKRRHQCTDPCTACFSQRRISKPHSCGLNGAPWNSGGMPVDLKGEGGWQQSALTVALLMAISAWCPTAQGFLLPASCCQFTAPRTPPTDAEDVAGTSPFCYPWSESDHCLTCSPAPWVLSAWGRPMCRNGSGTGAEDATTVMSAASKRRPPTSLQGWPSLSPFDSPRAARSRWAFGEDEVCSLPRPTVAQESRGLRSCGRLEAKKLDRDSSRHGGGEKHGAAAQAGGREGGSQDMGKGADSDASPAQNSPLRWMRRTLGAGWGRRGHRADTIAAGKWGFHRGGASKRRDRCISVGGSGQKDCEISMVGVKEAETGAEEPEEGENGWGLSGSVDAGSKGWPNEEVRHAWFSSFGGGGGNSGGGDGGKQTWGSKTPWTDRNALQELFRTKGGDLHIRTVAKIQTMLGQEDQAEETLLRLIRDPYHLGDASWTPESVAETAEWRRLDAHQKRIKDKHLKDVIQDTERSLALSAEYEGTILDYSRMNVSQLTMKLLFDLAKRQGLKEKIQAMFHGEKINNTENRAVLHVALRTDKGDDPIMVDGVNVVEQVHDTLDKVKDFSDQVRSGRLRGATGKLLTNIVAVGIGGSYLGPEFLHEAFKTQEYPGREQAELYRLRFLSNVDPVDVRRTLYDLDPEETLVVVISKTFTTAETMLNARTARQWLWDTMGKGTDPSVTEKHMAACASESSAERVMAFGIPRDRLFPLWDWVGGRYSVCSSVGALPLSLKYGSRQFENFLAGARSMDKHFLHAPLDKNLPVLMGLLGVWNISFMGYKTRTILPYAEALLKFPAHIQQLAMESNGKRVTRNGKKVSYDIGQVDFGEPGTNGQHSFFQLLHMGQICPAEFMGFIESQHPLHVEGEPLCSHDELMANFFAQPDALAVGKSKDDLVREGCRPDLVPHRTFDGNRPSLSLLVPKVNAYHLGQILALYEHRTAVEGFMWDINSFDQWGVELGKSLATNVREKMEKFRTEGQEAPTGLNPSTQRLMSRYLQQSETLVKKVGNINHRSRNGPDKTLNRGSSTKAA